MFNVTVTWFINGVTFVMKHHEHFIHVYKCKYQRLNFLPEQRHFYNFPCRFISFYI